jgi:exopolyphosphatase / guanosine-5'-triphosphate,3'-diphosphate pyrophosphatase
MNGAVIDVGSNTIRLLVARRTRLGLEEVCSGRVRVGLGAEIELTGRISDVKLAAAVAAVRKLSADAAAQGVDRIDVLVTAPGRQSENGGDLVAALERATHAPVQQLSAGDEARLAYVGAIAAGSPTASLVAVCDLGGASTEIAVGEPMNDPSWARSFDLGALRLTTRLLPRERPPAAVIAAARRVVEDTFAPLVLPLPGEALVVGGSPRALRKLVGESLGPSELREAEELLITKPHAAIARRYRIDGKRVPLLLAATLILSQVQRRVAVPLRVVDGGVRDGALLASLDALAA